MAYAAVIATGFEHIHRSNLVGMGVLPCGFEPSRLRLVESVHYRIEVTALES